MITHNQIIQCIDEATERAGIKTKNRSNLNWDRPVERVKLKQFNESIAVDRCCADLVRLIDALPKTQVASCCCGHGEHLGHVEFRSALPEQELLQHIGDIERIQWQDRGRMLGWWTVVDCRCGQRKEGELEAEGQCAEKACPVLKRCKVTKKCTVT